MIPKTGNLIYLASPYTHDDLVQMHNRYIAACHAAGWLLNEGYIIFAPIVHCHPIACEVALPRNWGFWKRIDEVYLGHSEAMIILTLPGWTESTGVTSETEIMQRQDKPIYLMHWAELPDATQPKYVIEPWSSS